MKGDRKYTRPVQITKKISSRTYETRDRRRWNINKLIKAHQPGVDKNESMITDFELNDEDPQLITNLQPHVEIHREEPETTVVERRTSKRQRRPPDRFKEYVMY